MRARDVLGEAGLLAQALPRFTHREAQVAMAELVERALEGQGVALVEAGTGTGKTFAYLVPALLSGRRVVVSTGTRTLQDQILEKDVPVLARAFGHELPITVLKGLPNYLCRRRYAELRQSAESVTRPELARKLPRLDAWVERTHTGDRAELGWLAEDDPLWAAVQSGTDTRIGPRCRHFESCFVTEARQRAVDARVIVVNHHLFFADLALKAGAGFEGAGVLPNYDAVIFDEAHAIEDVATQFFGVQLGSARLETLVRDAERALVHAGVGEAATSLGRVVLERAAEVFDLLPRSLGGEGRQPLPESARTGPLRERLYDLDAALEALEEYARLRAADGELVAQVARRTASARRDLGVVLEGGKDLVVWAQQRGRAAWLGASPVDVSRVFRDEVLHRTPSVVLTSATLSTAESFAFARARLGVEGEVDEAIFASPFTWATQALLYTPSLPDPRDPAHAARAAEEVLALALASDGGAFVLCTSLRAMNDLCRRATPALAAAGLEVLLQGRAPKGELLERFRASGRAVLFATASFWEGVDVPGHALRLVILDKLPFDVPSDPLVEARCARLESEGRAPFMEYLVPAAALALKQGFGRLVRTEQDRGVVAVLDVRLTTKGYGKVFLRTLPPARRTDARVEAEAFLRGLVEEARADWVRPERAEPDTRPPAD